MDENAIKPTGDQKKEQGEEEKKIVDTDEVSVQIGHRLPEVQKPPPQAPVVMSFSASETSDFGSTPGSSCYDSSGENSPCADSPACSPGSPSSFRKKSTGRLSRRTSNLKNSLINSWLGNVSNNFSDISRESGERLERTLKNEVDLEGGLKRFAFMIFVVLMALLGIIWEVTHDIMLVVKFSNGEHLKITTFGIIYRNINVFFLISLLVSIPSVFLLFDVFFLSSALTFYTYISYFVFSSPHAGIDGTFLLYVLPPLFSMVFSTRFNLITTIILTVALQTATFIVNVSTFQPSQAFLSFATEGVWMTTKPFLFTFIVAVPLSLVALYSFLRREAIERKLKTLLVAVETLDFSGADSEKIMSRNSLTKEDIYLKKTMKAQKEQKTYLPLFKRGSEIFDKRGSISSFASYTMSDISDLSQGDLTPGSDGPKGGGGGGGGAGELQQSPSHLMVPKSDMIVVMMCNINRFNTLFENNIDGICNVQTEYLHIVDGQLSSNNGTLLEVQGDRLICCFGGIQKNMTASESAISAAVSIRSLMKQKCGVDVRFSILRFEAFICEIKSYVLSKFYIFSEKMEVIRRIDSTVREMGACIVIGSNVLVEVKYKVKTTKIDSLLSKNKEQISLFLVTDAKKLMSIAKGNCSEWMYEIQGHLGAKPVERSWSFRNFWECYQKKKFHQAEMIIDKIQNERKGSKESLQIAKHLKKKLAESYGDGGEERGAARASSISHALRRNIVRRNSSVQSLVPKGIRERRYSVF